MDGGDLASIHSPAENNFVASLIQDRPVRGGEKVGDDDHDHHHHLLVPQKVASELHPKVRNHGEGPY